MAEQPIQPENTAAQNPPNRINIKPAEKKSDTTRIDLASAKPPPSIVDKKDLPSDADTYFSRNTMRIELPEGMGQAKAETSKINIPWPTGESVKKQTAKMDMPAATEPAKPVAPAGSPMRPKTLQVKRPVAAPGESIIVSPESVASATEQARKSETARIDLSAEDIERPATKPKTIRIKRPDGSNARKSLTISRPEEDTGVSGVPSPVEETASEEEEPGIFVGIMAMAALLVAGALFYVILAQTLAPSLPFPGRI